jgi:hypothetical protein
MLLSVRCFPVILLFQVVFLLLTFHWLRVEGDGRVSLQHFTFFSLFSEFLKSRGSGRGKSAKAILTSNLKPIMQKPTRES